MDDERVRALGRVALQWGYLELTVSALLVRLLDTADQESGRVVASVLSFKTKLEVLGTIADRRFRGQPTVAKEFKNAVARAKQLAQTRNDVLHSAWGGVEGAGVANQKEAVRLNLSSRKGLKMEVVPLSALHATADALEEVNNQFIPLFRRL